MSRHPTIDALTALVRRLELDFEVEPASPADRAISVRSIRVRHGSDDWRVPCFDEFADAEIASRAVRLHLVLDACVCFEEAADFDTWRRDLGFPDEPVSREIYAQLERVVPGIRSVLGPDAAPIDERAIEFNTDLAQALRACID